MKHLHTTVVRIACITTSIALWSAAEVDGSEVSLLELEPGTGAARAAVISESSLSVNAADNLIAVLNALFEAGSIDAGAYYNYFGVEPETPSADKVEPTQSGFLASCRALLGMNWNKVRLSRQQGPASVWEMGEEGDYTGYGVRVVIHNSSEFSSGILLFRAERHRSNSSDQLDEVSFRPSNFFGGR